MNWPLLQREISEDRLKEDGQSMQIRIRKALFEKLWQHQVQAVFWMMSLICRKDASGGIL